MAPTNTAPDSFLNPALIVGPRRTYSLSAEQAARSRAIATDAVGPDEPGPKLAAFVHTHVRPAYGLSRYKRHPLEVLDRGRGDCFEAHAVAMMLLRSVGVPCRFATDIAAARFEPGQALAALLRRSAAGPWTNTHVWTEAWDGADWQPLDTHFGVYGRPAWEAERLRPNGGSFGFRFPVWIRSLDARGQVVDDMVERYLLDPFGEQRESPAFAEWAADLDHFRPLRRGSPYLGARFGFQRARLGRMTRNLETLLDTRGQPTSIAHD